MAAWPRAGAGRARSSRPTTPCTSGATALAICGAVRLAKAMRPPATRYWVKPVAKAVTSWSAVARTGMLRWLALTVPGWRPAAVKAASTEAMAAAAGPNRLTN